MILSIFIKKKKRITIHNKFKAVFRCIFISRCQDNSSFFINYKHFNTNVESLSWFVCHPCGHTAVGKCTTPRMKMTWYKKAVLTNSFIMSSLVSTGKKNYSNREDEVLHNRGLILKLKNKHAHTAFYLLSVKHSVDMSSYI